MALVSYQFGFGLKQGQRSAMALAMATRNASGMFAAFTAFPNPDPRMLVMILLAGPVPALLALPWRKFFAIPAGKTVQGRCGMNLSMLSKIRWPRPFAGLQGVTLADVPREVSAGITLAALMIPLNIGYAQVAGLPPAAGLYAAIVPLVVFALLASSRHLVTSPDASMATLVGAALVSFAAPGDPLRMQYALALAVVCAVLFFLFWIFRLAFLANFLSRAVMAGFITGLGIEVFTNQVRKILAAPHVSDATSGVLAAAEHLQETLATSVTTEGYFVEVIALIQSIPRANLYSVAIGVGAFLIVRLMKRYAPKIPGALVALVLLTTLVALLDLPAKGVAVLGNTIPSGLPALTLPAIPLADYLRLLPGALAIVAILLCEGLLVVRSYSNKYGYKADGDQMLFAYGAANLAAGFTGSIVTGNSPSRSAAMDASGAQQPAAQPGGGGDHRAGDALLHRPAGVPAQCGPGRDRRQRGAVADRGPRTPRAVAHAALRVLDRRRLPAERAGARTAARRAHRVPHVHHRRHPAGVPSGHRGAGRSRRRQPLLRARWRGRRGQPAGPGRLSIRRPALLRQRDALPRGGRAVDRPGAHPRPLVRPGRGSDGRRRHHRRGSPAAGDRPAGQAEASPSPSAAPIAPSARGWSSTS